VTRYATPHANRLPGCWPLADLPEIWCHHTQLPMRQRTFIRALAYPSAATGLTDFSLVLWGVRLPALAA
jgi:hypothetical protein